MRTLRNVNIGETVKVKKVQGEGVVKEELWIWE